MGVRITIELADCTVEEGNTLMLYLLPAIAQDGGKEVTYFSVDKDTLAEEKQ